MEIVGTLYNDFSTECWLEADLSNNYYSVSCFYRNKGTECLHTFLMVKLNV